MSSHLELLIFDLFGVVISFDDDLVHRRLAAKSADPENAFSAMQDLVSCDDLICGRKTFQQLRSEMIDRFNLSLSDSDFHAIWCQSYTSPMPGMADLLKVLSSTKRIVLLSNVDPYYWGIVKQMHPELHHFDRLFLSFDLGVAKPNIAAFETVLAKMETSASNSLFIDDKLENINAASLLGLDVHHFTNPSSLYHSLQERGIACLDISTHEK